MANAISWNGELSDENLFPQDPQVMTGEAFKKRLEDARYYLIFADLKAFPKDGHPEDVSTYESYMKSSCELIVLTADSSFVTIYCKDQKNWSFYIKMQRTAVSSGLNI